MRPRTAIISAEKMVRRFFLLEHLRPDYEIGDAAFVLERDERDASALPGR
ncbi:hypothetical protein [Rhizobium mongolense]|uniref:Uncharacterized protein n=1 Tax=Rhizobium mongolense TaxID=57676 RepID=A0ABR6IV63_9HYPH|nr:hypothetical protein [Rhizobium mongolense]MBB4231575.1 hypothetical protein [Rhizobium mongolense]